MILYEFAHFDTKCTPHAAQVSDVFPLAHGPSDLKIPCRTARWAAAPAGLKPAGWAKGGRALRLGRKRGRRLRSALPFSGNSIGSCSFSINLKSLVILLSRPELDDSAMVAESSNSINFRNPALHMSGVRAWALSCDWADPGLRPGPPSRPGLRLPVAPESFRARLRHRDSALLVTQIMIPGSLQVIMIVSANWQSLQNYESGLQTFRLPGTVLSRTAELEGC